MRPRPTLPLLFATLAVAVTAAAVVPEAVPDLPVLGPETPRGAGLIATPVAPVTPSPKTVDGDVSDWIGTPTRYAGTAVHSAGEYVYQDYLRDAWGADDGRDAERLATLDPLREAEPRTYRLDVVAQVAGDEFGLDGPPLVSAKPMYGDARIPDELAALREHADIEEVRVAADATSLYVLVRTAQMIENPGTAVLVLLDTADGGSYEAPGGVRTGAEWALVVAGDRVLRATREGAPVPLPFGGACGPAVRVATNPAAYVNAVEVGLCREAFGLPGRLRIGVATGVVDATGAGFAEVSTGAATADLINVAFRDDEPVRIRMDRAQALALLAGNVDRYLAPVDLVRLAAGATETATPRPGYYERVYVSDSPVRQEAESDGESQGAFQHYGVWIPTSYRAGTPSPAMVWLHPRSSGNAHLAAAWVPGIIRQLGERRGALVVAPSARGDDTWYVGRGHEDFLEVWDDAMGSLSIDPDRVTLSGHSMGGFGSYLIGLLYPDRFAAAFPISGPPTQGGWFGAGPPVAPQDGGDVRAELLFTIVENARNLPYVIYHGANDELVNVGGVARMAARFAELGYRHRLYNFPGQDHYAPLVVDEWEDAARYLDTFVRDPNPPRVTYRVWPALEHQVETIRLGEGVLDYTFDGAYWVDGLKVRGGNPRDVATMGTIDATTYGRGVSSILGVPEAGVAAPGQSSPFLMTGLRWLVTGRAAARNAFDVTLTNLATARLDLARMGLATSAPIAVAVRSDGPAELRLGGVWSGTPSVAGATFVSYDGAVLVVRVAAGARTVTITP